MTCVRVEIVKVWPFAHVGVEVADRGGDALLVCVRDGDRKIAVLEESVLIREILVACALERLGQRLGVPGPMLFRYAPNGNRAVLPMPFVVEIEVTLELLEVRKHVLPLPARGPASLPLVIVGRRTAICHLAVDGRAAAEHARLLILPEARLRRGRIGVVRDDLGRDLQLLPEEAVVEVGGAGIGIENLLRLRARRRVLASLADEHLVGPPCGKTVGENGACRTAADDDVVELHRFPRKALFSRAQHASGSALVQSSMDAGPLTAGSAPISCTASSSVRILPAAQQKRDRKWESWTEWSLP